MKLERPITHIIFDLDGVLLDTEPLYTEATERILRPYGKRFPWRTKVKMMGRDARVAAQILVDDLDLSLTPDEYLESRKEILRELFANCSAIEGAEEWLDLLRQQETPVAIATSSTREFFAVKTSRHPWLRSKEVVLGDDPELKRPKPAPDIFLLAARRLLAAPEDCLVFEDSPAGVEAAVAAGMQCVALVDPNLTLEAFAAASFVIRGYDEIRLEDIGL